MSECECLPGCPFFNDRMQNRPATSNLMKKKFCLGDFDNCARHMIFLKLGKEAVPGDLFPHEKERALEILK